MRTTSTCPIAIGYIRNSKLNGRERGTNASATEQRRTIEQVAQQHGFNLLDIVYEEDTSGQSLDRPGWLRCRAMVTDGVAEVIIGWDLDRLSRAESWHTSAAVADIEAEGGMVYDRTGRITVSTTEGEIVTGIRSMMNRAEWRKIRERNAANVRRAIIDNGAHLSAPYGFCKPTKGAPLAIDEREAKAVRLAYKLRIEGLSWAAIANALNDHGVPPRRAATWSGSHVHTMLKNRVYKGTAWHGDYERPNAHAKVVSVATWEQANRVAGRKFDGDGPRNVHLLTGIVRCASCGYAMTHTRRAAKQGGWRYYQCQRKAGVQCPAPTSIAAAELEAYALDQFKAAVLRLGQYRPVLDNAALVEAEAALADATDDLRTAIANSLRLGDVSATEQAMVDDALAAARARVSQAEAAVIEARHAAAGIDLPADLTADTIEAEPIEQQRHLVGLVFATVVVGKPSAWRQPVEQRVHFIGRNEAPSSSADLIAHVVGLDLDPAGARVAAG